MKYLKFFTLLVMILATNVFFISISSGLEKREGVSYLYGKYNFATRRVYPEFNGMLNIIDLGHAQLAERLVSTQSEEEKVKSIEEDLFNIVKGMLLGQKRRPRFSPAEETIATESTKLVWKVNKAFDWTHALHRQVYDILSDDRVKDKDQAIHEALNYYLTEPSRVFPTKMKSMKLMEEQPFSGYWRKKYPKFNGAIWGYHWLQLVANEALLEPDPAVRKKKIDLAVNEFKQMFIDPSRLPKHMPMAHEVSPTFAKRFPQIAASLDNLHTFHDIYMDILTNSSVHDKRGEAYRQLSLMLDPEGNLETMLSDPLPPIPLDQQQPLLQMDQMEHMAMMMMSTDEQIQFLKMSQSERKNKVEQMMKKMDREKMDEHPEM